MNDTKITNRTMYFSWMDPRLDEALSLKFDVRYVQSLFFIEGDTGMVYRWDKNVHPNNSEEIRDWIMKKEYLNSTISFPAPLVPLEGDLWKFYSVNWVRANFGARFCKFVHRVPLLEKYAFGFICDYDHTDLLKKKEDRFNIVVFPLFVIFFGLPWAWWILKNLWFILIWMCTWNVYVYEDEKSD